MNAINNKHQMNNPAASSVESKGKYAPRGGELDPKLSRRCAFGIIPNSQRLLDSSTYVPSFITSQRVSLRPASSSSSRYIRLPVAWGSLKRINRRGFTVLEIMVSLVLISLVVVSVLQLSSINLTNLGSADDQVKAVINANSKMREILDKNNVEDKSWNETDDQGYSYEVTIAESLKERTDALAVKFVEITLVTSWNTGRKKKQIVLKTAQVISKANLLKTTDNPARSI
jgi:prepilin-type N-terminal cleavage/methylation domain-containing protein